MRKIFPLTQEGLHPDRVLDAVKHDIRKYLKRERSRDLPKDADFLDFDCRFGTTKETAKPVALADLLGQLDAVASKGGAQAYIEILARPALREARPAGKAR